MSSQTVARRYASALADVVIWRDEQAEVREELRVWEQMILSNALLLEAFTNPTIPYDQKNQLLNELIKRTQARQTTANFLRVLLKNQRIADLPQVNAKLDQVLDDREGLITARVTSARPVSEPSRAALEEALAKITRKRVRLTFETDESLLGGVVTRVGSTIYDGSVRNQLRQLGQELAGT
ncbi:MAG: ATP synthase F1 subunit delta [Acidobacteriota bacterium]|nr:ATP synthase F1 subunit delta [Acidobacteriota bacterium]